RFNAIRNMNQLFPDAYYIVIMRNPIKRAISAYMYFRNMGVERRTINTAFKQELEAPAPLKEEFLSYLNHGLYARQLSNNVFSQIDRDNVGLFFFDDIFSAEGIMLNPIIEFMSIPQFKYPKKHAVNIGGEARFRWLNWLLHHQGKYKSKIASFLPVRFRVTLKQWVFSKNKTSRST